MSRKFPYAGVKILNYSRHGAEHGDHVVSDVTPRYQTTRADVYDYRALKRQVTGNKGGRPITSEDSNTKNKLAQAYRETHPNPREAHGPSHASRGIYRKRTGQ